MLAQQTRLKLPAVAMPVRRRRDVLAIGPVRPTLRRPRDESVARFVRLLAVMQDGRVPLVRALMVISQQQDDAGLKEVVRHVALRVSAGNYLSDAMAEHPQAFSAIAVNMIRTGETVGNLAGMSHKLADLLDRDLHMKRQARAAMTYPAFVTLFSLLTLFSLFHWVVPPLLDACVALTTNPASLPWPTVLLVRLVEAGQNPRVLAPLLGGLFVLLHVANGYFRTPAGRMVGARLLLKVPAVGDLCYKLMLSQFCRSLAILLASGIRLQQTFHILLDSVPNPYFKKNTLQPLVEGLLKGGVLHQMFRRARFPEMICQLSYVGEMSGSLPDMLTRASLLYDEQVYQALRSFLQVLEPFLIGVMGVLVGFILVGVFMPLYSVMSQMQPSMQLDQKLRSILSESTPSALPPLRPRPTPWWVRPFKVFWQQRSLSVGMEVALVVLMVVMFARPPATRLAAPAPTPDVVHVRTRMGQAWEFLASLEGVRRPRQTTAQADPPASAVLMQDPFTMEILALDPRSGSVRGHIASSLVAHLLPGREFGVDGDGHGLFHLERDSLKVVPIFHSNRRIGDAMPSSDGSWCYVSFPEQDSIAMLDRNHRVAGTLDVAGGPTVMSLERDGSELWVACNTTHTLTIIDVVHPRILHQAGTPDDILGMVSGGDHVYLVGRRTVTVMEPWSGNVSSVVRCPNPDPIGWTLSPSTGSLMLATSAPAAIEIIDMASPGHVESLALEDAPTGLWLTP